MSTNGQLVFTDVDKITFKGVGNASNAVIDTLTGKIGVGVDSPDANLHVLGNSYVSTNLELGGTLIMGTVNVEAQHSLEAVTATGNTTPLTLEFTNPTTSLVASGNVEVGGNVVAGYLYGDGSNITGISSNLDQVVNIGNVTSNTVQFTNATTGLVTTANVEVGGELTVSGNVAVDTNTLFVDSVNNRVGVGTTDPDSRLHIEEPTSIGATTTLFHTETGFTGGSRGHFEIKEEKHGAGTGWSDFNLRLQRRVDSTVQSYIDFNPSGTGGDYGIAFGTGSGGTPAERMRIDVDGNVGIGTDSPETIFQIGSKAAATGVNYLKIRGNNTSTYSDICGIIFNNSGSASLNGLRGESKIINERAGNNYGSALAFYTNPNDNPSGANPPGVNSVKRMVIDDYGNVGIGTSPSSRLTINQIPDHRNTYDHSLAPMTITNRTVTSNSTLNDPKHVLNLAREGTSGEAYGARATFKLSRWENNHVNSRTRLDLDVAHGYYNEVTVMQWYSNGTVKLSGGTNVNSDDRIKYNEEDIPNALETLNKLKPQKYEKLLFAPEKTGRWIPEDNEWETLKVDTEYTWINEYGFIAQDVREVPELAFLVHGEEIQMDMKTVTLEEYNELNDEERSNYTQKFIYESNVITLQEYTSLTLENRENCTELYSKQVETQTPLSLNYQGIFVVAVKAIQELKSENETLKTQLASVLTRLDALENA